MADAPWRSAAVFRGVGIGVRKRPQVKVVGIEAVGSLALGALDLRLPQVRLHRADHAGGDPILQLEDVVKRAVVALSPDMRAGRRVDELTRNADAVAGLAHAALDQVAHAKLASDFLHVERLTFVNESTVA